MSVISANTCGTTPSASVMHEVDQLLAPYFRISYAASMADLQEACTRIQWARAALT